MRTENDSSNFPCGKNSKIRRRFSSRALLSRSCVLDAHAPAVSYPFHPSSLLPAGSTVIAFAYPAPPSLCSTQRLRWHSRGATLGMCAEHVRGTCARNVSLASLEHSLCFWVTAEGYAGRFPCVLERDGVHLLSRISSTQDKRECTADMCLRVLSRAATHAGSVFRISAFHK